MIIEELVYQVKVKTDELMKGKKLIIQFSDEAAQRVNDLDEKIEKLGETSEKSSKKSVKGVDGLSKSLARFGKTSGGAFKTAQLGFAKFLGLSLGIEATRRMIVSTTHSLVALSNNATWLGISAKSADAWGFRHRVRAALKKKLTLS
ncbi:hypothetical protein [Candidatus Arsenophonus triatominarum]|uniref:hypothetical protein n=1 Tax=Candidatus Arsenophonus triatominarum TaxID=57911 RepID=UPI0007C447F5|nr:hypothetical protein [Candidatus Arsenophonus triatominarum]